MVWYKVIFSYRNSLPDFRNIYAKNKKEAGKQLKDAWFKSTGATITIKKVEKR